MYSKQLLQGINYTPCERDVRTTTFNYVCCNIAGEISTRINVLELESD